MIIITEDKKNGDEVFVDWNSVERCSARLKAMQTLMGALKRERFTVEHIMHHWPELSNELVGEHLGWSERANLLVDVVAVAKGEFYISKVEEKPFFLVMGSVRERGEESQDELRRGDFTIRISGDSGKLLYMNAKLVAPRESAGGFDENDSEIIYPTDNLELLANDLDISARHDAAETADLVVALLSQRGRGGSASDRGR